MFNERPTLSALLDELRASLDDLGRPWQIVFVDDGSTDGSFDTLVELKQDDERIVAIRLRRNFGKAAALAAGFAHASGGIVITIDGDLQDDPREFGRLLAKLDEGFDVVSGWKSRRNDPWTRRFVSRIFNRMVNAVTGVHLHDVNCGLKAYRADAIRNIRLYGELHRFVPALAYFEGYRVTEIAVNHRCRQSGRSRYGLERYLRGAFDLTTVFFLGRYRYRPLHLFGGVGLGLGTLGFGVCAYLTVVKAAGGAIGHRPLLTLGVLLIVVGMQFLMMGLLGEMLTRASEERSHERRTRHVAEVA